MQQINSSKYPVLFRGRKPSFTRTSFFGFALVVTLFLLSLSLAASAGLFLSHATPAAAVTTVPTKMNFQGRLTDSTGNIKPNGTYNMKLRLYTVASAGSAVWSEDRLVSATQGVTITNGLFSIQLGSITSLPASLFASGPLYLEVELPTPATATSSTPTWTEGAMSPRNQMATSAYAYNAETLDGQDGAYYQNAANLTGTIASARLVGSYAGITGVGTLTSLTVSGVVSTGDTLTVGQTTGQKIIIDAGPINQRIELGRTDGVASTPYMDFHSGVTATDYDARIIASGGTGASGGGTLQLQATNLQLAGSTLVKTTGTAAFQVQDAGSVNLFTADTTNSRISIGSGGPIMNVTSSSATFSYSTPTPTTVTYASPLNASYNTASAIDDMDGDGDKDLIIGSRDQFNGTSYPGIISLYKNNGDGSYGNAIVFDNITGDAAFNDIAIADIDGDGDKDVVATRNSFYVSVYKNNGNATFAARVDYNISANTSSVAVGDIDGDGDKDIAATRYNGSGAYVLINNGTGTFTAGSTIGGGSLPTDIALVDIDGDGDLDSIIVNNSGNNVTVGKNNGTGSFSTAGGTYTTATGPQAVAVADIDNDGDKDIAVASSSGGSNGTLSVLKNNGTGSFAAKVDYNTIAQAGSVVAGDTDGDGDSDLLVGKPWGNGSGNTMIFQNTGATSFTSSIPTVYVSSPILADVDGDTDLDIIDLGPSVTKNNGAGVFGGSYNAGVESAVTETDLNADGKVDLVTRNEYGFVVHLAAANQTFAETGYMLTASGTNAKVVAADIDGDGDKDLILTSYSSSTNVWTYINNGTGSFTLSNSFTMTVSVKDIALADFDGDGDMDIAAVGGSSGVGVISVSLNNGSGAFSAATSGPAASDAAHVIATDIDGDGDQDIALSYATSGSLAVYKNNGSAVFSFVANYTGSGNITGNLVAVDIDVDGDKDIVTASASNTLVVFPNNGDGSFTFVQTYATGSTSSSAWLSVRDIDGDGDVDVAVGVSNGTVLHKNSGGGNLTVKTLYTIGSGATLTSIGDFNGDGYQDIASSSPNSGGGGKVLWNNNNASVISSAGSMLSVRTKSATDGGIYIQASVSQSAYLFVIQDASGAALMTVDGQGNLSAKGAVLGGVGSPDYAENITASDSSISAADVVAIDPANKEHVIKSSLPYQGTTLGVISTNPGFVTNATAPDATDDTQRPLALSGRVPVKVTNENGSIQPGDYLTTSSTPGHAMKATQAGQVIGRAMESFDGETGKVLMFIDNSYYNPYDAQHMQGSDGIYTNMAISGLLTTKELAVTGNARIEGSLVVIGSIETGDITVNGHVVTGGEAPTVAGLVSGGIGMTTTVTGNDVSGVISFTTGDSAVSVGEMVNVIFSKSFGAPPRVTLTPVNGEGSTLQYYYGSSKDNFILKSNNLPAIHTTYVYSYHVEQ